MRDALSGGWAGDLFAEADGGGDRRGGLGGAAAELGREPLGRERGPEELGRELFSDCTTPDAEARRERDGD